MFYVDFMSVRKIPLKERPVFRSDFSYKDPEDDNEDPEVSTALSRIRATILKDRAIYDKAVKAFVSFTRAYSKHEASYIFRIKDLDLVGIAKAFGLLRLPRMPELKDIDTSSWQDAEVDVSVLLSTIFPLPPRNIMLIISHFKWDNYSYLDKAHETKRLAEARKQKAITEAEIAKRKAARAEKKAANAAWSSKVVRKEEKEKRKDKKDRKRKWLKTQQQQAEENGTGDKDNKLGDGDDGDEDDWEALAKEERMAKKLKRGNISQGDFDMEFSGL